MEKHRIVVITDRALRDCHFLDAGVFDAVLLDDPELLPGALDPECDSLVVTHYSHLGPEDRGLYYRVRDIARDLGVPMVIMADRINLEQRLEALEAGVNDVILLSEPIDDVTTRLLREIYHAVADRQLKQQLSSASEAALAAMRESSNLGGNVHFLVQAHQCRNLDELGQLFFQSMKHYGLNCSLQMRSAFGVKNMEVNGMARQLESDLLTQLKDAGRYFDFGRRTVVNYGTVSVLIRNMPTDEGLYGLVKDNTFTLLQGLDARVQALDSYLQLEEEKCALQRLSGQVNRAILDVGEDYQAVMRNIVDVVENMAEKIGERIPLLLLNEDQEAFIEDTVKECVLSANRVFAEGFRVDSHFATLRAEIARALEHANDTTASAANTHSVNDSQDVELF